MSSFIDNVETFDLTTLEFDTYSDKIDGLLQRFPKYEKDDSFRTVLPDKMIKTADDYISMKFCTRGRYPIHGIYNRRDLNLVAICVEGNVMYALDDCDLHPSFVPDLKVHNISLEIPFSPLATHETLNYTRKCVCSAISTLSLGYMPHKKNEWCEAIVLLTGMTSKAVRFSEMKYHVRLGLDFSTAHDPVELDGRYVLHSSDIALQNRWNKISKAIRRGEYPYIFSFYCPLGGYGCCSSVGGYSTASVSEWTARRDVSLINDKDKTKRGKYRRKMNRWNGPLGNTKRKLREESHKRLVMEREARKIMKKMDDKSSEMMHGFWYGSVSTLNYEVACGKCLLEWSQMVSSNRFFRSATSYLGRLKDVLLAQRTLASILVAVKVIWNERSALLTCFQGTSMVFEDRGSSLDGYGSYFWFKSPRPDPPLPGATYRAIVDYTRPMYSAAAFYKCAKRQKVTRKDLCFDHIGIVKEKIDHQKVKLNREPRPSVQLGCGRIARALGTTSACPLQVITTRCRMHAQHSTANTGYSGMSHSFKRILLHRGLSGLSKGLVPNLLKIVPPGRAATKLKAAILVDIRAKRLLIKK